MGKSEETPLLLPRGFRWMGIHAGLGDTTTLDFGVCASECPCKAAALFTRNRFAGAPVVVGKEHVRDGLLQVIAVNSKTANVGTGMQGIADSKQICRWVGKALGIAPELVLPSSTGMIGTPLPMEKFRLACQALPSALQASPEGIMQFARAIMTTDTHPKVASCRMGSITLTAVAKGSGMIAPNMATMLAYVFTDADLSAPCLQQALTNAVECSFHRISVDTDTSTSDTVALLANGLAGPPNFQEFEAALKDLSIQLARQLICDAEGASKLLKVEVSGAPDAAHALACCRAVAESPLVKVAIGGNKPFWGRILMALGKVIHPQLPGEQIQICFGPPELKLCFGPAINGNEARLEQYLQTHQEVLLRIDLNAGQATEYFWGCDLTREYVRINAEEKS